MNSQLQTYQFNETPITLIDHHGDRWMTGEDIGLALEYADDPKNSVRKIFERNRGELEEYSTTVKLTAVDGKEREIRVYNEEGVIIITFLSKQPKAVEFRRWAAGVLKRLRQGQLSVNPAHFGDYLALQAKYIALLEQRLDALATPTASAFGAPRPWTPDEDGILLTCKAEGMGDTRIGYKLKRSCSSVKHRRIRLMARQGGAQ